MKTWLLHQVLRLVGWSNLCNLLGHHNQVSWTTIFIDVDNELAREEGRWMVYCRWCHEHWLIPKE